MLELFVDDEVVDVPPIEPVNQSYKYQVLQTVGGRLRPRPITEGFKMVSEVEKYPLGRLPEYLGGAI